MKILTALILFFLIQQPTHAQTEQWKSDANVLAGSIRSTALKGQYRKLIGWSYAQHGSFYADSTHEYAIVYVYDNKTCQQSPDVSVTKMSKDPNVKPAHGTSDQAVVYQSASGVYLLIGPQKKKTPFKIDTNCPGAIYVLLRDRK